MYNHTVAVRKLVLGICCLVYTFAGIFVNNGRNGLFLDLIIPANLQLPVAMTFIFVLMAVALYLSISAALSAKRANDTPVFIWAVLVAVIIALSALALFAMFAVIAFAGYIIGSIMSGPW